MSRTRKYRHYYLLLAVMVVMATFAVRGWRHTVPLEECSDLYRRYAGNPHVSVAFIRDFPVNDTLCLDVTTLSARDSIGWEQLKKDFRILPIPQIAQEKIAQGIDVINVRYAPKTDPALLADTTDILNNNVIASSGLYQTISVFYTHTENEQEAVSRSRHDLGLPPY